MLSFIAFAMALCSVRSFRQMSRDESRSNQSWDDLSRTGQYGGNGGGEFDFWHYDGLAGGINKICVRSGSLVDRLEVHFAGREMKKGGGGGGHRCFSLTEKEYIVKVWLRTGSMVDSIKFQTSKGRVSPQFGKNGGKLHTLTAPHGMHLMSFHGRVGSKVDKLGLYWGKGGGSGSWKAIKSCVGCDPWTFEVTECSERSDSHGAEVTSAWSMGTSTEMSAGFEFDGFSGGATNTITSSFSESVVTSSSTNFKTSRCDKTLYPCSKGYLWQWTFTSNFDGLGTVFTHGGAIVCTHVPNPCCLPGTFSDDPSKCDRDPKAPNTCK